MALLKRRPKIRLLASYGSYAGSELQATVRLDLQRDTEIEYVDATLRGIERWEQLRGNAMSERQRLVERTDQLYELNLRLSGTRTLPAGRTELPVRIVVPPFTPGSVRGTYLHIHHTLTVRAAIDWWPDAKAEFEIPIAAPPQPSPETVPASFHGPAGALGDGLHAELSLVSSWTRLGDYVRGAFALWNTHHARRLRHVSIRLRAVETRVDYEPDTIPTWTRVINVPGSLIREAEMYPFHLYVPPEWPADHAGSPRPYGRGFTALSHQLELRAHVGDTTYVLLTVPYAVLPHAALRPDAPLRLAPPTIGSDRLHELWSTIAAQHGLHFDAFGLRGRFGEVELRIDRDVQHGAFVLVVAMRYPSLHLGLSIVAEKSFFARDVRIGDDAFDEAHTVRARDAYQASTFLGPLLPSFSGARVRYLDDENLALEVRGAGQTRASLERTVQAAVSLARLLDAARQVIVPPRALDSALPAWKDLARRLNATLETARMRIETEHAGIRIEVEVERDEDAFHSMLLTVTPSHPFDEQQRFEWKKRDGSSAIDARFSGELRELGRLVCKDASDLRIEPERIVLALPRVLGLHAEFTSAAVAQRIERMVQFSNALRGQSGPYR